MQREKYYPQPFYWKSQHDLDLEKELSNYRFLCKSHWAELARLSYTWYSKKGYYFIYEEWKAHMYSILKDLPEKECKEWRHFISVKVKESKMELNRIYNFVATIATGFIASLVTVLLTNAEDHDLCGTIVMLLIFIAAYGAILFTVFHYESKRSRNNDFYTELLNITDTVLQDYDTTSENEGKDNIKATSDGGC